MQIYDDDDDDDNDDGDDDTLAKCLQPLQPEICLWAALLRTEEPIFETEGRQQGRGSWRGACNGSYSSLPASVCMESAVSSQAGFGRSPDRTCSLDALRAQKTRLVAAIFKLPQNRGYSSWGTPPPVHPWI